MVGTVVVELISSDVVPGVGKGVSWRIETATVVLSQLRDLGGILEGSWRDWDLRGTGWKEFVLPEPHDATFRFSTREIRDVCLHTRRVTRSVDRVT